MEFPPPKSSILHGEGINSSASISTKDTESGIIPPRSRNASASVEECMEHFVPNFRPGDETLNGARILRKLFSEPLVRAWDACLTLRRRNHEVGIFLA